MATQEDREAAAAFYERYYRDCAAVAKRIRQGKCDEISDVQMFVAHREAVERRIFGSSELPRSKALFLLKQALDVWEVDPDEASAEEQEAWANVLDAANLLAKITGEPEPG